jgi:hypothetical protein
MQLVNTNATVGPTGGIPSAEYYKRGRIVAQNDYIASQHFYANNYLGAKTEFGRLTYQATNSSAGGGDDGAFGVWCAVNGVTQQVMLFNGADNENNTFRPLDLNGNDLKTSSGNMGISTAGSTGTGTLTLATKSNAGTTFTSSLGTAATQNIKINPYDSLYTNSVTLTATDGSGFINSIQLGNVPSNPFIQVKRNFGGAIQKSITMSSNTSGSLTQNQLYAYDGQTNEPFQISSETVTGTGSIELKCQDALGDLILTGLNLESNTANSAAGYLRIKLNGTYYKIQLLAD